MIPLDTITSFQISSLRLPDSRLSERAIFCLEKIDRMGCALSFPAIFQSRSELKAFYRLANNKKVKPEMIRSSCSCSLENLVVNDSALSGEPYLLLFQDTTFGKYHHRKGLELGYFNDPATDNGVLIHHGILTGTDFVPLGLPVQDFILRDAAGHGKSAARQERSFSEKESYKWVAGVEWAARFEKKTGKKVIQVADRESDVAALMNCSLGLKQDFIFRCQQDRRLQAGFSDLNLKAYLAKQTSMATLSLPLLDEKGKAHEVSFRLKVASVCLEDVPQMPLQVLLLEQIELYEGQKELSNWCLITSLPVQTPSDAENIIRIYTHRWRTCEDFHKCLKTGCAIEERQFENADALFNVIALLSVLAIRLLRLRHLAQNEPEKPMADILDKEQLKLAQHFCEKMLKPSDYKHCRRGTVLAFVLTIAKLGGHQGFTQKGMPGWQTIWKGWNYFQAILNGIIMSKNFGLP